MATAHLTGRPVTFMLAALTIVVWAATGPIFHYSDTWQLVINTGTTIVTFLMVFLIQNTQNRDTMALQIKLDELIIAMHGAKNRLAAAEDLCDEDLQALHKEYHDARRASARHSGKAPRGRARASVANCCRKNIQWLPGLSAFNNLFLYFLDYMEGNSNTTL